MAESDQELIKVCFRMITEKTFTLELDPSLYISDIKALVEIESEIAPENQKLIFKGQLLRDNSTLASYNVESGSTIHVVGRVVNPETDSETRQDASVASGSNADGSRNEHGHRIGDATSSFNRNLASMGIFMSPIFAASAEIPISPSTMGVNTGATRTTIPTGTNREGGDTNWTWSSYNVGTHPMVLGRMHFTRTINPQDSSGIEQVASQFLNGILGGLMGGVATGEAGGNSPSVTPNAHSTDQSTEVNSTEVHDGNSANVTGARQVGSQAFPVALIGTLTADVVSGEDGTPTNEVAVTARGVDPGRTREGAQDGRSLLTDPTTLGSHLSWSNLERLELLVGISVDFVLQERTFSNFVARFERAYSRVLTLLNRLDRWHRRQERIQPLEFSQLASIFALASAINSQISSLLALLFGCANGSTLGLQYAAADSLSNLEYADAPTLSGVTLSDASGHLQAALPTISEHTRGIDGACTVSSLEIDKDDEMIADTCDYGAPRSCASGEYVSMAEPFIVEPYLGDIETKEADPSQLLHDYQNSPMFREKMAKFATKEQLSDAYFGM